MKIFYKIISFLTIFCFTLNCTSFASENPQKIPPIALSLTNFINKNPITKEKSSKKQVQKFDFNKVKQKLSHFGISFLKHIFSAIIDYCVASIMENLIQMKIKNKNNITNTL